MDSFNRRNFLKSIGAGAALAALPSIVSAGTTAPKVVIVGGGFAGATAAKYLRLWGGNIEVTMVDQNPNHIACILSNLVVTNSITMSRITIPYDTLKSVYGVKFMQGKATWVDSVNKKVNVLTGTSNTAIQYDHLILAPGIDFIDPNYVNGYNGSIWNPTQTPHAWVAGTQTAILKSQLSNMTDGGLFVMTVPKSPYRCPPGPYERACVVADFLKRKKPRSKILVLDENSGIQAEPTNFSNAFNNLYRGNLSYQPNSVITGVNSATKTIYVNGTAVKAAVLNYIPNQTAGKIVIDAGLNAGTNWAPVDVLTYASTTNPYIHIIGDSNNSGQPKSGHMANSQAKVAADSIIRAFNGEAPDQSPATNSACYSPITNSTASWLNANYQYDAMAKKMVRQENTNSYAPNASYGEAATINSDNFQQMFTWADSIFSDSFK